MVHGRALNFQPCSSSSGGDGLLIYPSIKNVMNPNPNLNTLVDNVLFLKDAPGFWRSPRFRGISGNRANVSIEIFYSLLFGQEAPTKSTPFITRGQIDVSESKNSNAYFVGLFVPSRQLSGFSYPPIGANQIDPSALFNAVIKHVIYIDQSLYDLPLTEYKPQTPQAVIDSFVLHGGVWTL